MSFSRVVLVSSSALLAAYGLWCLFLPDNLAEALRQPADPAVLLQLSAAGALGFAAVNWVGRGAIYGAIYGRPIVVGNFFHGGMLTLVLLRSQIQVSTAVGWTLTAVFLCYWIGFVLLLFRSPWSTKGAPDS